MLSVRTRPFWRNELFASAPVVRQCDGGQAAPHSSGSMVEHDSLKPSLRLLHNGPKRLKNLPNRGDIFIILPRLFRGRVSATNILGKIHLTRLVENEQPRNHTRPFVEEESVKGQPGFVPRVLMDTVLDD